MAPDCWGIISNVMRTRRLISPSDPMPSEGGHRTVLLHEAVDALELVPSDTVVDATIGGAGHSALIVEKLSEAGTIIGFDADMAAIERAKIALAGSKPNVHLIHANFRHIRQEMGRVGVSRIDKALFDLGWSSYQLHDGRGFSFLSDEPLSMAYDKNQELSAGTIVNEWKEESLADVIYGWGDERYARRIARAIVLAREQAEIKSARELGEIVKAAVPHSARYGRIHPATKTFQALRIAVNDELGALRDALEQTWDMLREDGRIAIISFHSLEDRIVKRAFANLARGGGALLITKKPIVPQPAEIMQNPRSRSAKLRVIQKIQINHAQPHEKNQ